MANNMESKIYFISILFAVAFSLQENYFRQPIGHHLHLSTLPAVKPLDYDDPAKYDFSYDVHDGHTGDVKTQFESRDGDTLHGSYSLIDPDGYKRIVEYTADDHNGFKATVHREPVVGVHKVAVEETSPSAKFEAAEQIPVRYFLPAPEHSVDSAASPAQIGEYEKQHGYYDQH